MSDEQTTPAPEGQVSEDNQSLLEVEKETPTDNQDVPTRNQTLMKSRQKMPQKMM